MAASRAEAFVGRPGERAMLDRVLADARASRSGVLVIRGEAGIGKTALLRYAAGQAADFRIVEVAGVEAEMELPFAGVHQLCVPLLAHLAALPTPQRDALSVAFGLAEGATPDRFLVALAVLSLLSAVAEERPLACLVEDAQWLDDTSDQVLGFVARRLLAEPVAMVFAVREPSSGRGFEALPELRLGGLDEDAARMLLAGAIPGRFDERVRDRIIGETRGNPLALLELPRGLSAAQLAAGFALPDVLPLSGRIEESFLRRLDGLADDTRLLVLVAAAEPLGDPALLWRAAMGLGIDSTALHPVLRTGLLEVGAQVRFRHPLVRSAVYRAATDPERRSAHAALAQATDAALEPDRRAWHRAQATDGPDEDVAAELERSAGRAQARGGIAAAAAFLRRAADLTTDAPRRTERLLAAAQLSLQAGSFDVAHALVAAAQAGGVDEVGRARVNLLLAYLAYAQNRGSDAPVLLLEAARTFEPLDARIARETYLDAWSAALFAGKLASAGSLLDVSRAVETAPGPTGSPRACDLLLDGFALVFTDGRGAAAPALQRAIAAFAGPGVSVEEMLRWGWLATVAAVYVWDYETCFALATREVEVARDSGALEVLAVGLNILSQAHSLGGDYANAALLIAEADEVRKATGTLVGPYGALVLAGFRGREAEASRLIDATIRDATPGGQGTAVQFAHFARAVVMNGLGRYEEALPSAIAAGDDTPELVTSVWALSEWIEAATRTHETALAERALARLAEHARGSDSGWALGVLARGRALLSDGEEAERLYREAIDQLARTRLRPDLARSHLLYGEWLRRVGRRRDAREHLGTAHQMLAAMGAEAFAERARRELAATGATVRKRRSDSRDELTPQELQIALLARDGLSNAEIGARLFLSPRTAEWHLHKVFAKLQIESRQSLAGVLHSAGERTAV